MPGPVRAFADHQPVTSIANAVRDLFTQQSVGSGVWIALAWLVGPHSRRVQRRHRRLSPPDLLAFLQANTRKASGNSTSAQSVTVCPELCSPYGGCATYGLRVLLEMCNCVVAQRVLEREEF
jgi:hypothetical protein